MNTLKIMTAAIALMAFAGAAQAEQVCYNNDDPSHRFCRDKRPDEIAAGFECALIMKQQADGSYHCPSANNSLTISTAWDNTAQCLINAKKSNPTWEQFRAACQQPGRIYDEACKRGGGPGVGCKRSYDEAIQFLQQTAQQQPMRAAPATPVAPKAPPVDTEKKPVAGAAQAPDMDAMMKKFEAAMDEGGPVNEGVLAEVTGDNWNGHTYPDVTLSEATKSCIKDHWFGNLIGPKTFEGPAGTKDMVIGCGARTYAEQYAAGRFLGSKTLTDESEAFMHSHGY